MAKAKKPLAANSGRTANDKKPRARARGKAFAKGADPRRNMAGRPPDGLTRAGLTRDIGRMTGIEAAEAFPLYATEFRKLGTTRLIDAFVARTYFAGIAEPASGMFGTVMDRVEGRVPQSLTVEPSEALQKAMRQLGLSPEAVARDPLATSLFRLLGTPVGVSEDE